MDTCPYSLQIAAYHDGELPEDQRQRFEQHLSAACPACARELEQLRRLSALICSAAFPRLSPQARQGLYRLNSELAEAAYLRIAKWTTAMAASVLLAASGWIIAHRPNTPTPAPAESSQNWVQVAMNPSETPSTDAARADAPFANWVMTNLSPDASHE